VLVRKRGYSPISKERKRFWPVSLRFTRPSQNQTGSQSLLLQNIDNNFLMQVVEEPTRRCVLLDHVLMNKERLVEDVKAGGSLSSSKLEMVEFRILYGGSRAISRITTLDFKRDNFGLFKDLLAGIPWVRGLEVGGL